MHLIECDGCKKQETFVWGVTKEEAKSLGPEGWGWREISFRSSKHGRVDSLLHACNVKCCPIAFTRAKYQLAEFSGARSRSTEPTRWSGFIDTPDEDMKWLESIKPEEGGQAPRKEQPKSKLKPKFSETAFAAVFDTFTTIETAAPVWTPGTTAAPTPPTPEEDVDDSP